MELRNVVDTAIIKIAKSKERDKLINPAHQVIVHY